MPGTDVAKKMSGALAAAAWPEHLTDQVNFESWAKAIILGTKYVEPIPDYISKMLALEAILAATPEEVFRSGGVWGLQDMIPDTPGASSGPMEITDLYVAESAIETGYSCFIIVSYISLVDGANGKFTTSATNVMSSLIGLLKFGVWPIRCQVKRGDSKDKSGKQLLILMPPD